MSRTPAYKVVVVGDAQSGKSSLLFRFQWKKFNQYSSSTVVAAFYSKVLPTGQRINMWDTAGQERFHSMIPMYLKNVDLVLFVYDITRRNSFEHLKSYWIDFVQDNATGGHSNEFIFDNTNVNNGHNHSRNYQGILIGNKTDLIVSGSQRQVTTKEGVDLAKSLGIPFVETSALDGNGVEEVWTMVQKLLMKVPLDQDDNQNKIEVEDDESTKVGVVKTMLSPMYKMVSWCNIL